MPKKRDAKWWRDYRKRRREKREQEARESNTARVKIEHVNAATGLRTPPAPLSSAQPIASPERDTGAPVAQPQSRPHPGAQQEFMEEPPGDLVTIGGQPAGAQRVAPPRRKHMKSGKEINSHIAGCMRMYGNSPSALLHVLAGYVEQLQDSMKRDTEDDFAEKVCEKRHPGSMPTGVYCRSCHEVEMTGKFGTLPPEFAKGGATRSPGGELIFPSDESQQGGESADDADTDLDLAGVRLKPPDQEKL